MGTQIAQDVPQAVASFYAGTIAALVHSGALDPLASTLVVCGGALDAAILRNAGFTQVTVSNLDQAMSDVDPFTWAWQDAEALTYHDGAFAQVIEHNGLHHCASPHRALLEMYRVASRVVLAFEPRDSLALRIARRVGLTGNYEIETVADHGGVSGGVRNSAVPNFVYRWSKREIEKTIASFDPTGPASHRFFHGLAMPDYACQSARRKALIRALTPAAKALVAFAPAQGNRFAFLVEKPVSRFPWLVTERCLEAVA